MKKIQSAHNFSVKVPLVKLICRFKVSYLFLFSLVYAVALVGGAYDGCVYRRIDLSESAEFKERFGEHSIHVIETNPRQCRFKLIKALERGLGRISVLDMANIYGAIGGINAGFFKIGHSHDGLAAGVLKIDHQWYALPLKPRAAIGWSLDDLSPVIDRLTVSLRGTRGRTPFDIDGLNRKRKKGEMILFSPVFHHRTLTDSEGKEVVIHKGVITQILAGGNHLIPKDGYVLSIHCAHPDYAKFEVGQRLTVTFCLRPQTGATTKEEWEQCAFIVGGTPLLISQGKKIEDFSVEQTRETFLTGRHARTAVGVLPNGNWLFVVVDRTAECRGMTMVELRDLMADFFHCSTALNMDGGGSATMVHGGKIKNDPLGDEDEANGAKVVRRVSDAILFYPRLFGVENRSIQ